ncbi:MAG TPA: TlpA disulfide reductase family protein [Rubrivivax sp.]|nr:TlpA disulfide reductase family protein [Rubrivivax sp.]
MNRLRRAAGVLGLAVLLVSVPVRAGTPGEVAVGQALRDATMQGLNGPPRKLSEFRGKPLVINVWASWCAPCRAEMASLERLAWSEAGTHFTVIGISTDDYPQKAQAWLKQSNATISHYIDERLQLEHMLGATHLPLTVLVDADGRVLQKVFGAKEWDEAAALALIASAFRNSRIARGR